MHDPWVKKMTNLPATVVSKTLKDPLDWPKATLVSGDAVNVVAQLKKESTVPLRSHGSLSMNRALMAAGLVDRVQVAHHFCPVCGCGTFTDSPAFEPDGSWDKHTRRIGVNARLFDNYVAASAPVVEIDGKNLW